jgi:hypothetical protein
VPSATITPSSSANSNLAQGSLPKWLIEIHQKLWSRRDLVGEIFRKANLNKTDFFELQRELQTLDPSRNSESHIPMDVLPTKSEFLRSRSVIDEDVAAYFATCGAASDGNLVPQPVVDTSKDIIPSSFDVGADAMDDAMENDADSDADSSDEAYLTLRSFHAPFGI